MKRTLASLLLILLIQCALVATVYWPDFYPAGRAEAATMMSCNRDLVDEIQLADQHDNEAVLRKAGNHWLLPQLQNLPADTNRIEQLLTRLCDHTPAWPNADTVAARQRFQVAADAYQRRLRLYSADQLLGTLYLGDSPGFRKVQARNDSQNAIYTIALSIQDTAATSVSWVDRKLLQIRTPLAIVADSYSLHREGDIWLSGLDSAPDARELQALLSALRNLQVIGVAAVDRQQDLAAAEPDLVLMVESLGGQVTLELFQRDGKYFIHSSEYPLLFALSGNDFDELTSIDFRLISGEQPPADALAKPGGTPPPQQQGD